MKSDTSALLRTYGQNTVAALLAVVVFLLPLKWGTLAVLTEAAGFYPDDLFSWLIINFPAHSLGLVSAVLLGLALIFFPFPALKSSWGIGILLWGILLPLATLPGWVNSADLNWARAQTAHWCGVGALALTMFLILSAQRRYIKWCAVALALGVVYLGLDAWHQYFFGFQEMRDFIAKQIAAGVHVSEVMKIKVEDTRVYATFVSCNALAGFLLLTAPVVIYWLQNCGKRFEPVIVSRWLFGGGSAIILVTALLMTKSRGAFLCALVAVCGALFCRIKAKKWKILLVIGALLCVLGGATYIQQKGRGFLSMSERVDYLRSSVMMCVEKPILGHGWGGFFRYHMLHKTTTSDESARDPHNLVASFASQCGILSGLIVLAALGYPLIFLGRRWQVSLKNQTLFWGYGAFALHCLMEINGAIPANLAVAVLLMFLADVPTETPPNYPQLPAQLGGKCLALILLMASWGGNFPIIRTEKALDNFAQNLPKCLTSAEVTALVEQCLATNPRQINVWEQAGDWFFYHRDYATARKFYQKAQQLDARRPGVWRRLGNLAYQQGDILEAKRCYGKAHALFPTNPEYNWQKFQEKMAKLPLDNSSQLQ